MNAQEQGKFETLYQNHLQTLALQGKRPSTIDLYSRAVRRLSQHFDRCPTDLTKDDLKDYFAELLKTHSWSTIKTDRCGLQFFWKHVLQKSWEWVDIVKPPRVKSLPDVLTVSETCRVIQAVREPRYRVFFLTVYSMGLRLGEGLRLQISDIDSAKKQVHVHYGKGRKDRFVPLPEFTLSALRTFWKTHRHPRLLFPNQNGNRDTVRRAKNFMDRSGVQAALKAALRDVGITKRISVHSLRHSFATHLVEAGVNLRLIQDILGHASPETTAIYTRLTEPSIQDRATVINALMDRFAAKWG